jgi:hypothetical protein
VGGQRHAPAALPPGKTGYPMHRRLDGPQSRSGPPRKISSLQEFESRNVQPVASRYTDYAVPAPASFNSLFKGLPSRFLHSVYNSALFLASCCCSFLLHVVANLICIFLISFSSHKNKIRTGKGTNFRTVRTTEQSLIHSRTSLVQTLTSV